MKRIIIPAGTVSGKKDYILEIPIDSNDQDENAIYILDDKSSTGSIRSLSDYFYNKDSDTPFSPEFAEQYPYQTQQNPQTYKNQSDLPPSNYMLKQEYENNYQYEDYQNNYDISQNPNYYYYKSIGFTESELHKLLASKSRSRKSAPEPLRRKQMKFNRFGVSDFTSMNNYQNSYLPQYDSFVKPINTSPGNADLKAYNSMVDTNHTSIRNATSTGHETSPRYYEGYLTENQYVPKVDPRFYEQTNTLVRSPIPPIRSNTVRAKQSSSLQKNISPQPSSNQKIQNTHNQSSSYGKGLSPPQMATTSNTATKEVPRRKENSQEFKSFNIVSRTSSPTGIPNKMGSSQKSSNNFVRRFMDPQKRLYRTLPGTSVVSNVPNIRIRNPITS